MPVLELEDLAVPVFSEKPVNRPTKHALYRIGPKTGQLLAWIGVLLIFIPKMNIVSIATDAAGLRLDDILLFLCLSLFVVAFLYWPSLRFRKIEVAFAGWVGFSLVSNALNMVFYGRSNPLYSVRFVEYFLFFYFGHYFKQRYNLINLAKAMLWISAPIMLLQQFGIIGGFASAGYVPAVDRAIGLTGGPWEVGVIVNFCLAILIFSEEVTAGYAMRVFLLTTAILIPTASRMAMVANIVIIVYFFRHRGANLFSIFLKSVPVFAILGCALFFIPNPLQARSEGLFSTSNFDYLQAAYARIPDSPTLDDFPELDLTDTDSDLSWMLRAGKWSVAVKMWVNNPTTLLFGIGPGTFGPDLDGGWLRVLAETGVVGMGLFLFLGRSLWKISPVIRAMLMTMAVNMLMLDIYISYKVVAFLLFTAGYLSYARSYRRQRRRHPMPRWDQH